jgi:hypothetical protein
MLKNLLRLNNDAFHYFCVEDSSNSESETVTDEASKPPKTAVDVNEIQISMEGWIRRRSGDTYYLTRDDSVVGCVPSFVMVPVIGKEIGAAVKSLQAEDVTEKVLLIYHDATLLNDTRLCYGSHQNIPCMESTIANRAYLHRNW